MLLMSNINQAWPPTYTWRKSARATRMSLRISPSVGLVLVTPANCSEKKARAFLESERVWVEKHASLLQTIQQTLAQPILPQVVSLSALGLSRQLCVLSTQRVRVRCYEVGDQLVVSGAKDDAQVILALKRWLRQKAWAVLPSWCESWATLTGWSFDCVRIRSQKTIWGSCDANGVISLNDKCLLLPPSLVDYILVHELAHTVEANHSSAFWRLVEKHIPSYRDHVRQLKAIEQSLPIWVR